MSGYTECACCGEVIVDSVLCDSCEEAGCDESGDGGCNVAACPDCETPESFMSDRKWHPNCDCYENKVAALATDEPADLPDYWEA